MDILIPKTYYEFNPEIPIGTKIRFTKNLDPKCKAYDPDRAGSIGTITKVSPHRITVLWYNSKGEERGGCIDAYNYQLEGIEIEM